MELPKTTAAFFSYCGHFAALYHKGARDTQATRETEKGGSLTHTEHLLLTEVLPQEKQ